MSRRTGSKAPRTRCQAMTIRSGSMSPKESRLPRYTCHPGPIALSPRSMNSQGVHCGLVSPGNEKLLAGKSCSRQNLALKGAWPCAPALSRAAMKGAPQSLQRGTAGTKCRFFASLRMTCHPERSEGSASVRAPRRNSHLVVQGSGLMLFSVDSAASVVQSLPHLPPAPQREGRFPGFRGTPSGLERPILG